MKHNAIGVIGGMGPEASQHFYGLLISHVQKEFGINDGADFPEIYIASLPVPDIIENQTTKREAIALIQDRIKRMQQLPIGCFCMACNTGHLFLPELENSTDIPFVSLLDEVPAVIKVKHIKNVGLLATPTTIRTRLYEDVLNRHNIHVILPEEKDIERLGEIINETIGGKHKTKNAEILREISGNLLSKGAEGILLGCTELPLIFKPLPNVVVFNTLDILSHAVLKRWWSMHKAGVASDATSNEKKVGTSNVPLFRKIEGKYL